jgi:hypothetical protein
MVDVAQLVEPRIVIPAVAGSSPVVHPTFGRKMCPHGAPRQSASAKRQPLPQLMY